jgi:mannosyltransferase OCH1-like enzyme
MYIPKYMHFIWFQGSDTIPNKYLKNMQTFIDKNPTWIPKLWDEVSIKEECKKYSSECLDMFLCLPTMMMKIELGRYVILYNHGGISIDMDMECIKPLEMIPFLYTEQCILSEMNISSFLARILSLGYYSKLVNNATFICSIHHHFMKILIDTIIKQNKYIIKLLYHVLPITISTVNITGSVLLTKLYLQYNYISHVLLKDYIEMNYIIDKSVIIHRHDLTWTKPWERYIRDLFA